MAAETGQGHRVKWDANIWRQVFKRQQASGQSVVAFCRAEAIKESTFYRWRAQLGMTQALRLPVAAKPAFVDLGTLQTANSTAHASTYTSAQVELHLDLGGGLSLHLVRR